MDLTPIKISGKNTRDNRKKAIAERKALKRPRGRPLKFAASDAASSTSSSSTAPIKETQKRTLKNMKSRRKMSLLEKLPTELLEKVFLYCMNLDLPRSSPVLAGKLSSEVVYLHTIAAAFSPTWDKWHARERFRRVKGSSRVRDKFERAEGCEQGCNSGTSGGDPTLQSAILRCRWASLSRLLGAKENWVQRNAQDRVFKPHYFLKSQNVSSDGLEDETASKLTAMEYFNNDFAGFSKFTRKRDGGAPWEDCSWNVNTDVTDGVEIPNSLLLGPWTDEMIKHLFWIKKSGASIDWLNSTSGEVALEGLKTAITRGDIRAIHLLEWAGLIEKFDIETLTWAFRNAGGDKIATVNQILRLGFAIDADRHCRIINRELADIRHEAEVKGDQATIDFVDDIKNSETLWVIEQW